MFPFKELPVRSSFLWLTWVRTARRLARRPSVPHFRKVPHSWHSAELQARVSASGQLPARPLHRSCIGKLWMYEDLWFVEEIWRNCINVYGENLMNSFLIPQTSNNLHPSTPLRSQQMLHRIPINYAFCQKVDTFFSIQNSDFFPKDLIPRTNWKIFPQKNTAVNVKTSTTSFHFQALFVRRKGSLFNYLSLKYQ